MSEREDRGGDTPSLRLTLSEIEERIRHLVERGDRQGVDSKESAGIDRAVEELRLDDLQESLQRVEDEIHDALDVLAEGRSDLREVASQRLPNAENKLEEASSAAELAASDMLDRLERALELTGELEPGGNGTSGASGAASSQPAAADGSESEGKGAVQDALREELHELIQSLQFQDITAQQLRHASHVLQETEDQLRRLSTVLFGEDALEETVPAPVQDDGAPPADTGSGDAAFDPDATTEGASDRQEMADEIFG